MGCSIVKPARGLSGGSELAYPIMDPSPKRGLRMTDLLSPIGTEAKWRIKLLNGHFVVNRGVHMSLLEIAVLQRHCDIAINEEHGSQPELRSEGCREP
jgi:hypothetical protein